MREVFTTFLRLGCTSFGGPVAHLAYFRRTLVEDRRWIDESAFARIVAFCSVLPGPTSSQVAMLTGFTRGGALGALAAWLGFTTPSAVVMILVGAALGSAERHATPPWFDGLLAGLFAAAAAVVAQAVVGLAGSLTTDAPTKLIAIVAMIVALALRGHPGLQWVAIAFGAVAGALLLRAAELRHDPLPIRVPRVASLVAGAIFVALVAFASVPHAPAGAFLATLIRAGALVFGGGHVVLPLLQSMIHDRLIGASNFFAGYGAVQALPGPINTFASFLGYANLSPLHGIRRRAGRDRAHLPAVVRADLRARAGMEPRRDRAARRGCRARRERERRRPARGGAVRSRARLDSAATFGASRWRSARSRRSRSGASRRGSSSSRPR